MYGHIIQDGFGQGDVTYGRPAKSVAPSALRPRYLVQRFPIQRPDLLNRGIDASCVV